MKKILMIVLIFGYGLGQGIVPVVGQESGSKTDKCDHCKNNIETGVPFLSNVPYANRLFTNVGIVCECEESTTQEEQKPQEEQNHVCTFKLTNAVANEAVDALKLLLHRSGKPTARLHADLRTNSVFAMGTPQELAAAKDLLVRLDKPNAEIRLANYSSSIQPKRKAPQDDQAEMMELRIENAVLKTRLEAMEEKIEMIREISELRAKLNSQESKPRRNTPPAVKTKAPTFQSNNQRPMQPRVAVGPGLRQTQPLPNRLGNSANPPVRPTKQSFSNPPPSKKSNGPWDLRELEILGEIDRLNRELQRHKANKKSNLK